MDVKKMVEELAAGVMHNARGCVPTCQCSNNREATRKAEQILEQLAEEKGCYMYSYAVSVILYSRISNLMASGAISHTEEWLTQYAYQMEHASRAMGASVHELAARLDGLNGKGSDHPRHNV